MSTSFFISSLRDCGAVMHAALQPILGRIKHRRNAHVFDDEGFYYKHKNFIHPKRRVTTRLLG